ncbi:MAG: extracellular solute-binding protein, partial [Clostridiales bacterium]|nr:extracellular solute-binding protein [Clostridiales bacterium]
MMKKLVTLILAIAMMLSMLAVAPGMAEEVVELNVFYDFSWLPQSYANSDSRIFKAVEEVTGVRMNVTLAKTSDGEQINLMLTSGDLPDIVCVDYASPIYGTLRESNEVLDLMPLIEQYAPEFKERMGEGYWNFYKSDAGVNNYFANCAFSPAVAEKYAAFGGWCELMAVRQDIYEALCSPALSTPEELLEHLRTVRETYPDVKVYMSANAGSLALTGRYDGLNWWKTAFGIETYYENDEGKVVAAYNHPQYEEAIKFINTLYLEGFITREDLAGTDESNTARRESGEIYMFQTNPAGIQYAPAGNPDVRYIAGPVFDTWKGTQQGGIFWCATFITKNCKNPEAAIKLLDYLTSTEGDRLNQWGIEGEDWEF